MERENLFIGHPEKKKRIQHNAESYIIKLSYIYNKSRSLCWYNGAKGLLVEKGSAISNILIQKLAAAAAFKDYGRGGVR